LQILGYQRYRQVFQNLVNRVFPMILNTLLNQPGKLVAQDAEDQRVRGQWAAAPSYPIVVYSK